MVWPTGHVQWNWNTFFYSFFEQVHWIICNAIRFMVVWLNSFRSLDRFLYFFFVMTDNWNKKKQCLCFSFLSSHVADLWPCVSGWLFGFRNSLTHLKCRIYILFPIKSIIPLYSDFRIGSHFLVWWTNGPQFSYVRERIQERKRIEFIVFRDLFLFDGSECRMRF